MHFSIEQQAKSGLGGLHWVRVAGPFDSRAEAEAALSRRQRHIGAPQRVVSVG